ncbi:MAG: Mth938-like domain-containing protein [Acidiferrobacteraceae bacterium]
MKIHLQAPQGLNTIRNYTETTVTVNNQSYDRSLVVLPDQVVVGDYPQRLDDLTDGHLSVITALAPELVLIGTGRTLRILAPVRLRVLIDARLGFEVMDTGAACRTFNILVAEGRRVAALLLLDS